MGKVTVADIMTRNPITLGPEANLIECARKMVRKRVGSLVIAKNKKLLGYISEHDILWALIKKYKKDIKQIKSEQQGLYCNFYKKNTDFKIFSNA